MKKITLLFALLFATFSWQANAQFTEDFEGTFLPTGWVKVVQTENDITQSSDQNHTIGGTNSCRFSSYDTATDYNQYLFTDAITVQAGVNDHISFWHKKYNTSAETLEWGIATGQTVADVSSWTAVTLSDTDWVQENIDLTAYVGQTIYFAWHYYGDYLYYVYIDDVISGPIPTFVIPSFTLTSTADCPNSQFSVDVNVTDLGGATSVSVTDDQGSAAQQLTAAGTVTMGPYPSGTEVTIVVTNDQDAAFANSDTAVEFCAPVNDECDNAIALTVSPDSTCANPYNGNNVGATASSQADDVTGTPDNDVWYSFVATNTVHYIGLSNVVARVGSSTDMGMGLYDATNGCSDLTLIADSDPNSFTATGLTVGTTYLLRVYGWSGIASYSAQASFDICIATPPPPPANDTIAGAIPFTPSPEGTGCDSSNYTFQAWQHHSGVTDSGLDSSCSGSDTGFDVFYSWTATSIGLVWNDGAGHPGIAIRDAATGNEITCEGPWASNNTVLSGWNVGDNLIIQIYDGASVDADVSFCLEEISMFPATFTTQPVADCTNNQFSIDVDVTSLGGATSVTISDDQGSATQQLTAVGSVTFGPYAFGTNVTITVTNDQDTTITSTHSQTLAACPPANDDCANAIALNLDVDSVTNFTAVDNSAATFSAAPTPSCASYNPNGLTGDLWYTVTVPATVTEVTLDVNNVTGITSVGGALYSGDCASLTEVSCTEYSSGWPWTISGLTAGETYYLRVWDFGNDQTGTFDLGGFYSSASIADNQIKGFNFYPNPVNNTLNLSAQDNIERVSIYNISGQEVLHITPNAMQTQVDMSRLLNGIYFVKAQINGQLTAFKVVKK